MMRAQHIRSALASYVTLSLFACSTLEPPQPCYSDAQCPTHMSCVASACVIETVSVSHEFKLLPDQGAPDMDMDMGGAPAEDMTPPDPYPTQSAVCRVDFEDGLKLEPVPTDPNRPTGVVVNLHKFFCFGDVLGVLGRDLTTSAEEQALEDPNLLTLNVWNGEAEAWERLACNGGEFPKVEADGLKTARLTRDGEGDDTLSLELEYQREGGALSKRAITWGGNCREFDLPPDSRERPSGDLTSYVTGAGLSIGSWVQESGEGVIALHNVSSNPPACRPNFDIFGVEQALDIWGATLGGEWFSWLSLIPKIGSEDIGEVILMIQERNPNGADDCEPYRTLRVGTWPLDFKAQKDWRSAIQPHVDPLSKQLWFCNMTEGRVCRLNRWQEGEGLQWLTDQDGQAINLSLTAEYDVLAGHLVVREQIEYPFPYQQLRIYNPCSAPRDEESVDLNACLTLNNLVEIGGRIHDYQIILLGDPTNPDQGGNPYLFWIQQDERHWIIKKTKL